MWFYTFLLGSYLTHSCGATASLLPYPRSAVPTGQGGAIYVVSEANITERVS